MKQVKEKGTWDSPTGIWGCLSPPCPQFLLVYPGTVIDDTQVPLQPFLFVGTQTRPHGGQALTIWPF